MKDLINQTKNRTVFTSYDQFAYTLMYITKSEFFIKFQKQNLKPVFKYYDNPYCMERLSDQLIVGIYMDWLLSTVHGPAGVNNTEVTNILYLLRVARFLTAVRKTLTKYMDKSQFKGHRVRFCTYMARNNRNYAYQVHDRKSVYIQLLSTNYKGIFKTKVKLKEGILEDVNKKYLDKLEVLTL